MPQPRSALIAGATGLVGGFLLDSLLKEDLYHHVAALVRRPLDRQHPKLKSMVADFDQLDETTDAFRVDDVFCCLGTTIKTAGSQAAFRRVESSNSRNSGVRAHAPDPLGAPVWPF